MSSRTDKAIVAVSRDEPREIYFSHYNALTRDKENKGGPPSLHNRGRRRERRQERNHHPRAQLKMPLAISNHTKKFAGTPTPEHKKLKEQKEGEAKASATEATVLRPLSNA